MQYQSKQNGFTLLEIMLVITIIGATIAVVSLTFSRSDGTEELAKQGLKLQTFFELLSDESIFQNTDIGIVFLRNKVEIFEFDYQSLSTSFSSVNEGVEDSTIGFGDEGLSKEDSNAEVSQWKAFEHDVIGNIELDESYRFELVVDDEEAILELERDKELPPEPSIFLWASGEASAFQLSIVSDDLEFAKVELNSDGLGRFQRKLVREDDN